MNTDDHIFRIVLIVGFVLLFPVGFYHRMKAHTGEDLDRRQEGRFILYTLRPLGMLGMAGLIAYMVNPAWMAWSSVALPVWLRWCGAALGALAGALLFWTFRHLGKNITDTVVTRKEHALITTGPYHWVRHPFYTSAMLAFLANSLVAANWFLFVNSILFFILIALRTRKEEENLLLRFSGYKNYMEQTGRFLPKLIR